MHVIAGDNLGTEAIPRKTVKTDSRAADVAGAGLRRRPGCDRAGARRRETLRTLFSDRDRALPLSDGRLGIAYLFGLGPSLLTAVGGVLCYNFFFIEPLYTFTIADPSNIAALLFFLITALAVSNLTTRARRQAETARNRAATTNALYTFSKNLASIITLDDLLWASVSRIAASLKVDAVILMPGPSGAIEVAATFPPGDTIEDADIGAAQWCFDSGRPAGHGADTLPGARRLFLPLRTSRGVIGVIGLGRGRRPDVLMSPDERRLLDALMDQAAVAIERVRLATEMDEARVAAEAERLRGALLTSLSHDLKTPLASILGSANSLREYGDLFDAKARDELVGTIEEEAGRLSRFVANLLDMTRLEADAIELKREPADMSEMIGAAVHRVKALLEHFDLAYEIEPGLPLVDLDVLLMEQVLINLLDNAAKYAPPASTITIGAKRRDGAVLIQVIDEGPGIPEDRLTRIFEKFHRVNDGDRQRAGTGLGLAICRGLRRSDGRHDRRR